MSSLFLVLLLCLFEFVKNIGSPRVIDRGTSANFCEVNSEQGSLPKKTSMSTLIFWNVSKVIGKNPHIDLKSAIQAAQDRLERHARDVNAMICQYPEERHLACALLAWKQLGHKQADSLYHMHVEQEQSAPNAGSAASNEATYIIKTTFIENHPKNKPLLTEREMEESNSKYSFKAMDSNSIGSYSPIGPVIKLPVDTKIVMRVDSVPSSKRPQKRTYFSNEPPINIRDKIDAACSLDSDCVEQLAEVDETTADLRSRAAKLARREAERVELLERAEAAWKDLELGYQRRIRAAQEKVEYLTKQTHKLIEERNENKNDCSKVTEKLKEITQALDKDKNALKKLEKEVCDRACERLHKSEEAARTDAALAENQCRAAQLDRDLRFKEEQIHRKMLSQKNEMESARSLTHEAERAMRCELGAIQDQMKRMSDELFKEDDDNRVIKKQVEELRQEKMDMIEDLEGCKMMCDSKMQAKLDELKQKREHLAELKEKVLECRCKVPIDASVEIKRTPSLVALCNCKPEEKFKDSCSCTSLRTSIMTNLLADLFGGLQGELSEARTQMPCQLLKCLEDNHNWDRSTVVKSNLRNYFSKLLVGELDIAIATSIEMYHVKWVGMCCADVARLIPEPGDPVDTEGWEKRALEQRAQKLATKLAEQLFEERADELTKKAKDAAAPPCKCGIQTALYPCLVKTAAPNALSMKYTSVAHQSGTSAAYWRRTLENVTQLRVQIEDMKKESIKKEDLKCMEEKITQIVQQASTADKDQNVMPLSIETVKTDKNNSKIQIQLGANRKLTLSKNKPDLNNSLSPKKKNSLKNINTDRNFSRPYNKTYKNQSFAINLCLCGSPKETSKLSDKEKIFRAMNNSNECKVSSAIKNKSLSNILAKTSGAKKSQPIRLLPQDVDSYDFNIEEEKTQPTRLLSQDVYSNIEKINNVCRSDCMCFHKMPSNTSIDKLLDTLTQWKPIKLEKQRKNIKNVDISKRSILKINSFKRFPEKTRPIVKKISKNETVEKKKIKEPSFCGKNKDSESGVIENFENNKLPIVLPTATESVYMGEINLDKSIENTCKCDGDLHNKKKTVKNNCNDGDKSSDFPVKCINSRICDCKKYTCNSDKSNKNCGSVLKANKTQEKIVQEKSHSKEEVLKSDIHEFIKKSFPQNCGYFVKFLGVTLIDVNNCKGDLIKSLKSKKEKKGKEKRPEVQNTYQNLQNVKYNLNTTNFDVPACHCNINLDELKQCLGDTLGKQRGDFNSYRDEAQDTQSFQNERFSNQENCVCCNKRTDKSEVDDLEANTFQLLRDHLREKLEAFRNTNCSSSCISKEEEEKLCASVLDGVRNIIMENTKSISCQCSEGEYSNANLNRAFCLLQEYLKTKIKRVECSCLTQCSGNSILPSVMKQVKKLIENDFKRLKTFCKCKKNLKDEQLSNIPDKNMSNKKNYEENNISKVLFQNTPSQVSKGFAMESKSCDLIVQDIPTEEIVAANINNSTAQTSCLLLSNVGIELNKINKQVSCCSLLNAINPHLADPKNYYLQAISQSRNKVVEPDKIKSDETTDKDLKNYESSSKNIMPDNINMQSFEISDHSNKTEGHPKELISNIDKLSYIGFTLSCSCDNSLGSCVCAKSNIHKNRDKIDEIWNSLTNRVTDSTKSAYLFSNSSNVKLKVDSLTNIGMKHIAKINKDLKPKMEKLVYEAQVMTDDNNIVLKRSNENVTRIQNNAASTCENGMNFRKSNMNFDLRLREYESKPHKQTKSKQKDQLRGNNINNESYSVKRSTSEVLADDGLMTLNLPTSRSQNCDCNLVPICHVKMLIKNIESKFVQSKCTCESLTLDECPIHYKMDE